MTAPEPGTLSTRDVKPISEPQMKLVKPLMKLMSGVNVFVYRLTNGRLMGRFSGADVCLVTMTGRKSGREITIPLIYTPDGEDVLLVASQGGMPKHPAWYYSLAASPEVKIQVRGEVRDMVARQASDEEKRARWPRLLEVYPDFDDYQKRTDRNIPVFICSPKR
jgi:deazaflavin-dependent oxidoreductase (nitroreductase family)